MSMDTMNETGSRFIMTGADIVRMGESAEMLVGGKNYNTALISRVEGIRTPQFRAIPATAFHVVLDESRVNASLVYEVVDTAMAEVDWASPAVASDHTFFSTFVRRAAAEIRERGAGKSASTCLRDFINQVVHGFAESQENIDQLRRRSMLVQAAILSITLPAEVDEAVRRAYREGYLRKSVVRDPLADRRNTGDNAPAVIHWKIVPGNAIDITITPKGMGSENMSRIFMLKPADGAEGIVRSVVETVREAGSNPCPPIVIGVGIGGNFETAPLAAKEALLVPCGVRNPIEYYAKLEEEILREVNKLGIGPSGCGGTVTALDAHIVTNPTHIAGMPVAVNICCHALRHAHGRIEGRG